MLRHIGAYLICRNESALRRLVEPDLIVDHLRAHRDDQLGLFERFALLLEQAADDGQQAQGMLASLLLLRFSNRPPMTTTWPLRARTMESDWRVVDGASGRLKTLSEPPSWMLLF